MSLIPNHIASLLSLDGQVALITGAASGIGRAQAELFLAAGARVVALDRDSQGLARLADEQAAGARQLCCLPVDLTDGAALAEAAGRAEAAFGAIDILCNTAGALDGYARCLDTPEALWDRIFDVNVKSLFRLTHALLPAMLGRGQGVVINVASVAACFAGGGGAAYTSSKHAVLGFTRQLAYDYGRKGIRANAICPGMIDTAMTETVLAERDSKLMKVVTAVPAGRVGQALDIAHVALFLAGPGAAFMHGAAVMVDGGLTIK